MTTNTLQNLLPCGLIAALASSVVAQHPLSLPASPESSQAPGSAAVMSQAVGMDEVDGALRAGGPLYKSVFDQGGVQYTPALGSASPTNQPLRFTLHTIRRGGVVLYQANAAVPVKPSHKHLTATYQRGPNISETYEARTDGLKQNFTFDQPIAGAGDLVVEGHITTDLPLVVGGGGGGGGGGTSAGLNFVMPGIGGVRLGAVVGIDANGQRTAGGIQFEDQTVRFTLPSQLLDSATYPLVLDPLISTTASVNTSPAKDPDVAFDETHDQYLVVWEHEFSGADIDVRAQKVDLTGNLVATAILVTNESGNEINPSVANVDAGSAFLVAYQDGPGVLGPWNIRGRRVNGGSGTTTSALFNIVANPSQSEIDPVCSGDNSAAAGANDGVIVAYATPTGIRAVKVDVSAAVTVAGPVSLINGSNDSKPAISKSGGAAGRHLVLWQSDYVTDRDVSGVLIDRNLNILDSFVPFEVVPSLDSFHPAVDGDGNEWMVTYQRSESGSSGPCDIYCKRASWNGTSVNTAGGGTSVQATPGKDEREPAIGDLGTKFVLTWALQNSSINYDIVTVELDRDTCTTCGELQYTLGSAGNLVDFQPKVATRYSGRASNAGDVEVDQAMIVWMDAQIPPPFQGDIIGNLYEAYGGGAVTDLGHGCGFGGTNGFDGPVALGNASLKLTVDGAGSDLLLCSIMFVDSAVGCGPCQLQSDAGSFIFAPGSGGSSSLALPIPCDASFIGVGLFTQWACVSSGASPCAILPAGLGISLSNRLGTTIEP